MTELKRAKTPKYTGGKKKILFLFTSCRINMSMKLHTKALIATIVEALLALLQNIQTILIYLSNNIHVYPIT